MELKSAQVQWIKADLIGKGLYYQPLHEDLLDHVCVAVEEKMSAGQPFMDAYLEVIERFTQPEIQDIQAETTQNLKNLTMIRNYLVVGFRSLVNQRTFSLINISGLMLGFICAILIFLYVDFESSYDSHHTQKDNIYRLVTNRKVDSGDIRRTAFTGAPWGPALKSDFPEVLEAVRFMKYRLGVMITSEVYDKKFFEDHLIWASPEVFNVFDIPLTKGDPKTALIDPNTVVISERLAEKYFGSDDPIGQTLIYETEHPLTITGVMNNMPENSHFYADILGSFNTLGQSFWDIVDNWTILYYYTYLLFPDQYDASLFEAKLPGFYKKYLGDNAGYLSGELQPLRDIYISSNRAGELKANTSLDHLYLLGAIAIFIIILAVANFINLTTAKSLQRAREVGVRKVMGGLKSDLFLQFLTEAIFIVTTSMCLAIMVVFLLLPYYRDVTGRPLDLISELWWLDLAGVILSALIIGLIAGLYPSFLLSRISASVALKGSLKTDKTSIILREGLVVFQFAICIALITSTLQVNDQLQFIQTKDLGFEKDDVLILPFNNSGPVPDGRMELIKRQFKEVPGITSVTITSHKLIGDQPYGASYVFKLPGQPADTFPMGRLHVDDDFIHTYGLELVAGRSFDETFGTDTSAFLINEQATKLLGVDKPSEALNAQITYNTQNEEGRYLRTGKVIGVVKDFNFKSLHYSIEPMVMDIQPDRSHFIACKLSGTMDNGMLSMIQSKWALLWPEVPFEYSFLSNHMETLYQSENNLEKLFSSFSIISIVIACLGMIGLASYSTSLRIKEIGVRKVLGASLTELLTLLLKTFLLLCFIGLVIGAPVSYFFLDHWLSEFVYRSPIEFKIFF